MFNNPFKTNVRAEIGGLSALIVAMLLSAVILVSSRAYREAYPAEEVTWEEHLSRQ